MNEKLEIKKETINAELISSLVLNGDIGKMSDVMKVQYYNQLCHSLNLNPVTRPFQLISFQGKSVLYATKDCTEQLRKLNGVSVVELVQELKDGLCISKCKVQDNTNRYDIATGVVSTAGLKAGDLANAIMKSETKAKRRATLSICGLGMLDESELDTMPTYTTSDISKVKVTEEVKSEKPFNEIVTDFMKTIISQEALERAYDRAKKNPQYNALTDEQKANIDEVYLDCISKFIKTETKPKGELNGDMGNEFNEVFAKENIPFDIPAEEVKTVEAVSDEMPEIAEMKACKNVTDLNKVYKKIISVPTYKQYAGEYQEEIDNVFESCKEQIKSKSK
jgi:hypothetical protein